MPQRASTLAKRRDEVLDLGSWCILRTGSVSTLTVFDSLREAGFAVWTPVERKLGRTPRKRDRVERSVAMMPTYVFAHVQHIEELARLALTPNREHPRFSLFKHREGYPLVAQEELESLSAIEDERYGIFRRLRNRGRKGPKFEIGAAVHTSEGGFAGLSGIVEGQQGQYTLVSYAGFHKPIKIASLLLLPEEVTDEKPHDGTAAQAA